MVEKRFFFFKPNLTLTIPGVCIIKGLCVCVCINQILDTAIFQLFILSFVMDMSCCLISSLEAFLILINKTKKAVLNYNFTTYPIQCLLPCTKQALKVIKQ